MSSKVEKKSELKSEGIRPTHVTLTVRRMQNGTVVPFVGDQVLTGVYQLNLTSTPDGAGIVLSFDSRFVNLETETDSFPEDFLN